MVTIAAGFTRSKMCTLKPGKSLQDPYHSISSARMVLPLHSVQAFIPECLGDLLSLANFQSFPLIPCTSSLFLQHDVIITKWAGNSCDGNQGFFSMELGRSLAPLNDFETLPLVCSLPNQCLVLLVRRTPHCTFKSPWQGNTTLGIVPFQQLPESDIFIPNFIAVSVFFPFFFISYSYITFYCCRDVLLWAGLCEYVRYHMLFSFQWRV